MKSQTWNKILTLALVTLSFGGCTDSTPTAGAREGGMSGGGGGTLPAKPATAYDVWKAMLDVKDDLRPFVRFLSWSRPIYIPSSKLEASINEKLFLGQRTLMDMLEETPLDYREDRPCTDSAGKEVEGSVVNTRQGSICISAYRIAPRVTVDNVRIEVEGLVLHELSHILGTTEEEAVAFQQMAVEGLRNFSPSERKQMVQEFDFHAEGLAEKADELMLTSTELSAALNQHGPDIVVEKNLSVFDAPANFYDAFRTMQLIYLNQYIECQSSRPDHAYWCDQYGKLFGSSNEVAAIDLDLGTRPLTGSERDAFRSLSIKRIQDHASLLAEVSAVTSYFVQVKEYAYRMSLGGQLPYVSNPVHESGTGPLKNWIGKYSVIGVDCDSEKAKARQGWIIGLDIASDPTSSDQILFKRMSQNGSGTDPVANGVQSNSGYIELTGTDEHPVMKATRGVLWSDLLNGSWSRLTEEFFTAGGKAFYSRHYEEIGVRNVYEESCRFEIKKVSAL
jgi:hypothetical protein